MQLTVVPGEACGHRGCLCHPKKGSQCWASDALVSWHCWWWSWPIMLQFHPQCRSGSLEGRTLWGLLRLLACGTKYPEYIWRQQSWLQCLCMAAFGQMSPGLSTFGFQDFQEGFSGHTAQDLEWGLCGDRRMTISPLGHVTSGGSLALVVLPIGQATGQ